jgi:signal transduction histidine kinase
MVIRVVATGVGMTPDEQRQMFDKFYRTPYARVTEIPGAGLGLAVVKSLVEAHGGSVKVRSTVDVGTVVTGAILSG